MGIWYLSKWILWPSYRTGKLYLDFMCSCIPFIDFLLGQIEYEVCRLHYFIGSCIMRSWFLSWSLAKPYCISVFLEEGSTYEEQESQSVHTKATCSIVPFLSIMCVVLYLQITELKRKSTFCVYFLSLGFNLESFPKTE